MALNMPRASNQGLRTYSVSPTPEYQFKPHQRVYDEHYNSYTKNIDLRGIKAVNLPPQQERIRPEKLHIVGGLETSK